VGKNKHLARGTYFVHATSKQAHFVKLFQTEVAENVKFETISHVLFIDAILRK
jgi:hypothetical protein